MTAKLKVLTFGEYIEIYKSHLLDDSDRKLTMSAFCRLHGIRGYFGDSEQSIRSIVYNFQ